MKKLVALAVLGAMAAAIVMAVANPFRKEAVPLWSIVQDLRAAYTIKPIRGLGLLDLPRLDFWLQDRQLAGLWDRVSEISGGNPSFRVTKLKDLLGVKHVGPSVLARVLVFHAFDDEAEVAPTVLGYVKQ